MQVYICLYILLWKYLNVRGSIKKHTAGGYRAGGGIVWRLVVVTILLLLVSTKGRESIGKFRSRWFARSTSAHQRLHQNITNGVGDLIQKQSLQNLC